MTNNCASTFKPQVSADYEAQKHDLLTKHPLLDQRNRRETIEEHIFRPLPLHLDLTVLGRPLNRWRCVVVVVRQATRAMTGKHLFH